MLWAPGGIRSEQVPLVMLPARPCPLLSSRSHILQKPREGGVLPKVTQHSWIEAKLQHIVHWPSSLERFLLCCKGTDSLMSPAQVAIKIYYLEYGHHQHSCEAEKGLRETNEMCPTCSWGVQAGSLMTLWRAPTLLGPPPACWSYLLRPG